MSRIVVLYEDKRAHADPGRFPLHDLVLRLVEDEVNGETWRLAKQVLMNPRGGVSNVLKQLKKTHRLSAGGPVFVLVDRDALSRELKVSGTDEDFAAAIKKRSDAPDRVFPYFLLPNVEGVIRHIEACQPGFMPSALELALRKKHMGRDLVFREAAKAAHRALRDCVREKQPGLDGLANSGDETDAVAFIPVPSGSSGDALVVMDLDDQSYTVIEWMEAVGPTYLALQP